MPTLTTVYMLPVSAVKAVADHRRPSSPSWATGASKRKTLSPLSRQALRWPFLVGRVAGHVGRRVDRRAVLGEARREGLVAGLVVRAVAAAAGAHGRRGVAQERGRAVGREDAQLGADLGQAGEHELRGLVRRARRAVVREVVLAGVIVVGDARASSRAVGVLTILTMWGWKVVLAVP